MADNSHQVDPETKPKRRLAGQEQTASWDGTGVIQPELIVRSGGELHGRSLTIRLGTQVLGREPNCELYINDGFISRRHAIILREKDAVWIQDAASANGTRLNGEQLLPGRRRPLRSGDVVRIGRIDLVYLDGLETPRRRSDLVRPPIDAPPVEILSRSRTDDTPPLQPPARPAPSRADGSPLSPVRLALSAAAASVTALVLSSLHVDQLGATAGAALTTVVTTILQTHGRFQWLRIAAGAALALALAVAGITLPEVALGRSLTDPDRPATFVPAELTAQPSRVEPTEPRAQPDLLPAPDSVSCDGTAVGQDLLCSPITVQSTGSAPLRITSLELIGPAANDFQVDGTACLGRRLQRGEACTIGVLFQPTEAGPRLATLIVHQNLPKPDTGTQIALVGEGLGEPITT
jgi:FHA domain